MARASTVQAARRMSSQFHAGGNKWNNLDDNTLAILVCLNSGILVDPTLLLDFISLSFVKVRRPPASILHLSPRKEQHAPLGYSGPLSARGDMSSSMLWDIDVDVVHQAISQHQDAIVSLDTEIEGFMRTIRQLQYQKQKHLAEIRQCKGMITLAKRLPPEILASIFEECVHDGWTRTPLIVSHVCSSWRMAATIPTVWSHVYVNLDARAHANVLVSGSTNPRTPS
ncbi:hypothetical protein BDZ97DRAFT_1911423 [Flammula alnicola]|nr:hypothetical protein BDZ97DRAFT_1911423 [Flammula alnicola]